MPTPSNNGPEPQSPRSFSFAICPDVDEANPSLSPLLPQPHASRSHPHSPPNWAAHQPPAGFLGSSSMAASMQEHSDGVRMTTVSPWPPSGGSHGHEGLDVPAASINQNEDGQKPADMDEIMTGSDRHRSDSQDDGEERADLRADGTLERGVVAPDGVRVTARQRLQTGKSVRKPPRDGMGILPDRVVEGRDEVDLGLGVPPWIEDTALLGMGYEYADTRIVPVTPSSYLRPGSRFHGTQKSERQQYEVQVEIKHVDLRESFLCGYLRIQGLTEDHPTLTTYFEGEIIGSKYGFITQHPSWGANDRTDLSHWNQFKAFRPFAKQARKGGEVLFKDVTKCENIFMRWKEHFLVPDHRVRTINGASFEGFYYICFNQQSGEVSGIYYHHKSERFQQLELKHVENRGCFSAMEFR